MGVAKKKLSEQQKRERKIQLHVLAGRLYEIEDDLLLLGARQASYKARDLAIYVRDLTGRRRQV